VPFGRVTAVAASMVEASARTLVRMDFSLRSGLMDSFMP